MISAMMHISTDIKFSIIVIKKLLKALGMFFESLLFLHSQVRETILRGLLKN